MKLTEKAQKLLQNMKFNERMQKLILWVCSFTNIIALVLAGGYVLLKGESSDVRRTAVYAFLVHFVFLALTTFHSFLQYLLGTVIEVSSFYLFSSKFLAIINIVHILVYAAIILLLFLPKKDASNDSGESDTL